MNFQLLYHASFFPGFLDDKCITILSTYALHYTKNENKKQMKYF